MEKGSFQKSPFSRDSRVSREFSDCVKERRLRPFSRDSREFRDVRDSRDFSSEKTPFVMTPFSGPDLCCLDCHYRHLVKLTFSRCASSQSEGYAFLGS